MLRRTKSDFENPKIDRILISRDKRFGETANWLSHQSINCHHVVSVYTPEPVQLT